MAAAAAAAFKKGNEEEKMKRPKLCALQNVYKRTLNATQRSLLHEVTSLKGYNPWIVSEQPRPSVFPFYGFALLADLQEHPGSWWMTDNHTVHVYIYISQPHEAHRSAPSVADRDRPRRRYRIFPVGDRSDRAVRLQLLHKRALKFIRGSSWVAAPEVSFLVVLSSASMQRPGLVPCLPRTYGDLGDLAKRGGPDRAVSPGIDISEELSEAGRS
ncbi:hypothetical protein JOB18_024540 [Solea senegalensis]|uniref:Uncharacterized protein n=1 Tax=Solea senegalensis TaxID=28829 RepID=A0AAV6Q6D3_SOLSE|nr:hypothetical protein JOB18_024540 [Solea senegalensis]